MNYMCGCTDDFNGAKAWQCLVLSNRLYYDLWTITISACINHALYADRIIINEKNMMENNFKYKLDVKIILKKKNLCWKAIKKNIPTNNIFALREKQVFAWKVYVTRCRVWILLSQAKCNMRRRLKCQFLWLYMLEKF